MDERGEEKLLAVARHIAKTLGRTDTMTDDILQVFSSFDGRFSLEKLLSDVGRLDPSSSPSDGHQTPSITSLERTIRSLDRQISRFVASDRLIWSDSADASSFLEAIDDLLATIQELDPPSSASTPGTKPLIDRADDLLQRCMLRLEEEFRAIIERPDGVTSAKTIGQSSPSEDSDGGEDTDGEEQVPVAHPVESYDIVIDALPPGSLSDLHEIARRMVNAGFGRECAETYAVARRDFVDESIARLGIRSRSADEVQAMTWANLEDEIPRWIKGLKMVFLILIPSERRLCDRVFASLPPFADLAIANACRPAAVHILSFADAIAAGTRAPERLFRVIDMYEAVRDILPELEPHFSDQYSAPIRSEVAGVHKRLGGAIRTIFMELENLIRRDPAKAAVPGGGLHPIIRYVMNYLRAACASRRTLEEVMEEDGVAAAVPSDPLHPSSSFAVQMAWIMEVLQTNLDAKSKIYRELSLSYIFLMNNSRYIIQKVKDSELAALLGEEWLRRQISMVRRWGNDYQRGTWAKVVAALRTDGVGVAASAAPVAAVKEMRERLKMFNAYLEEIWRVQGSWVVADEQLKLELRLAVLELVLPPYRNFVARMRQLPDVGRNGIDRFLKYSVDDVEARINELFEGSRGRRS